MATFRQIAKAYAADHGRHEQEVIEDIKAGKLDGLEDDGHWYVRFEQNEKKESPQRQEMPEPEVTKPVTLESEPQRQPPMLMEARHETAHNERNPRMESPNQSFLKDKVVVTDIKMPFLSMVVFMVKAAIAAIPAFIILAAIGLAVFTVVVEMLGGGFGGLRF